MLNISKKTEIFDAIALLNHIYSGNVELEYSHELKDYINHSSPIENVIKYKKIDIIYEIPYIGRLKTLYLDNDTHTKKIIKSQTNQWNYTKYETCKDLYDDVDIVNCQSSLLQQLMEYNKLPTEHIKEFNEKREDILKVMMKTNKLTRKEAKKKIIIFTYASDNIIKRMMTNIKMPRLVNKYLKQLLQNRDKLLKIYPQFKKEAIDKHKNNSEYNNIDGCAFALLAQTLERICLLSINDFFSKKNIEIGALIYDGVHLIKTFGNDELLKECENHVCEQTNFNIKLLIKPFEKINNLENVIRFETLNFNEHNDITIKQLNSRYLMKNDENDKDGNNLANEILLNTIYLICSYTGS